MGETAQKKPTFPRWVWVLAAFVAVGVVVKLADESPQTDRIRAEIDQGAARVQIARPVVAGLKKALRDPDSLKLDSVRVDDQAKVVCIEYRAKNGMGGVNREFLVSVAGRSSADEAAWNKHCTKSLPDVASSF